MLEAPSVGGLSFVSSSSPSPLEEREREHIKLVQADAESSSWVNRAKIEPVGWSGVGWGCFHPRLTLPGEAD